jgi:hypothetical protein
MKLEEQWKMKDGAAQRALEQLARAAEWDKLSTGEMRLLAISAMEYFAQRLARDAGEAESAGNAGEVKPREKEL